MNPENNMYFRDVVFMLIIGMYIQSDIIINGFKNAIVDILIGAVGAIILLVIHQRREKKMQKLRRFR
jgi:hypothetical protein